MSHSIRNCFHSSRLHTDECQEKLANKKSSTSWQQVWKMRTSILQPSLLKILLATLLTASTLMASPNPLSETELLKSPDVISLVTRDRTDHTKCQTGERPISTTKFGRVKCSGSTSISASYLWKFYGTVGIMWALEIAWSDRKDKVGLNGLKSRQNNMTIEYSRGNPRSDTVKSRKGTTYEGFKLLGTDVTPQWTLSILDSISWKIRRRKLRH